MARSGKKRSGRKGKTFLFVLEILLLLVLIGGLYVYGQIDTKLNKIETPVLDESKIVTNVTAPEMTGYKTYALFGIDHRSKNAALNADNSDTIIVASVNNDTKDVKLVSIYRDTLLDIGGDTFTKANAAYAYGGPEKAISMLNTMLDLNITDYATVDFGAMVAAIDALGGLDIPLSYAEMVFMNDYCIETSENTGVSYTPLELPERPENIEETLGEYHLSGVQAVSYCRIRYTASLDMGRTERQRRVIQLMTQKAKSAGITTIFKIMDNVFPMVSTSVTKTELLNLLPSMLGYGVDDTIGFPMNYKFANIKKASVIIADTLQDNVIKLHEFLYGADGYTPSQNIVDASARIIEIVGGAETLVDEAPVEPDADASGEVVWQGDGEGNYSYSDYTDYEDTDNSNGENGGEVTYTEESGGETGGGEVTYTEESGGETGYTEEPAGENTYTEEAGGETYTEEPGGGEVTYTEETGGGETYTEETGGGEAYVEETGGDFSGGEDIYYEEPAA